MGGGSCFSIGVCRGMLPTCLSRGVVGGRYTPVREATWRLQRACAIRPSSLYIFFFRRVPRGRRSPPPSKGVGGRRAELFQGAATRACGPLVHSSEELWGVLPGMTYYQNSPAK